jgi:hypothetical protein
MIYYKTIHLFFRLLKYFCDRNEINILDINSNREGLQVQLEFNITRSFPPVSKEVQLKQTNHSSFIIFIEINK